MNSRTLHTEIVNLQRVAKVFDHDGHSTVGLRGVSLEARAGELIVVLGPSGSGKTTLLSVIAGFLKPTRGCASLFGRNLEMFTQDDLQRLRAEHVGFIFQNFLLIDSLTVLENVALVLQFNGHSKTVAEQMAREKLALVQMTSFAGRFPANLSQGEKQRVAIARAIGNGGDLILADEPTASLESAQGFEVIRLLQIFAQEHNKCVIVASHDLRLVEFADRVLRLEDGKLVEKAEGL